MWNLRVRRVPCLLLAAVWAVCVAGTRASISTVNGAPGQSVFLPAGILVGPDITEVEWRRTSPRTKVAQYSKGGIEYFGSEEYKQRVTLHPGNFSLEIRGLRNEDAGDYEVTVTMSSGAQTRVTVRLEVPAATAAPPPTVNGALRGSVFLPPGIATRPVSEVVWSRISPRIRIVQYSKGKIEYFGAEEYRQRVTLHPGNFSLEICDLRKEDAGDYEVTFAVSSGAESKVRVRLEVSAPDQKSSNTGPIVAGVIIPTILIIVGIVLWVKRDSLPLPCVTRMRAAGSTDPAVTRALNSTSHEGPTTS